MKKVAISRFSDMSTLELLNQQESWTDEKKKAQRQVDAAERQLFWIRNELMSREQAESPTPRAAFWISWKAIPIGTRFTIPEEFDNPHSGPEAIFTRLGEHEWKVESPISWSMTPIRWTGECIFDDVTEFTEVE